MLRRLHAGDSANRLSLLGWPMYLLAPAGMRTSPLTLVSLALGFSVSLLKASCTGHQAYLPSTILVMGVPARRVLTVPYLLLHRVASILPPTGVLCPAFLAGASQQLTLLPVCQRAVAKLLTAGLFLTRRSLADRDGGRSRGEHAWRTQ